MHAATTPVRGTGLPAQEEAVNEHHRARSPQQELEEEHRELVRRQQQVLEALRRAGADAQQALFDASRPRQELLESLEQMRSVLEDGLEAARDEARRSSGRLSALADELEAELDLEPSVTGSAARTPPGPDAPADEGSALRPSGTGGEGVDLSDAVTDADLPDADVEDEGDDLPGPVTESDDLPGHVTESDDLPGRVTEGDDLPGPAPADHDVADREDPLPDIEDEVEVRVETPTDGALVVRMGTNPGRAGHAHVQRTSRSRLRRRGRRLRDLLSPRR
jgi:hypothetical protein